MGYRSEGGRRSRSQGGTFRRSRRVGWVGLAAVASLIAAGCASSSTPSAPSGSNTIPKVSINSFTVSIGPTMSKFKPLTQFATKGATTLQVGVILPDTTSSTRYVQLDEPYLK